MLPPEVVWSKFGDVPLGQMWTFRNARPMSALPPKADIADHDPDVR
jgi:hypothetical protein